MTLQEIFAIKRMYTNEKTPQLVVFFVRNIISRKYKEEVQRGEHA